MIHGIRISIALYLTILNEKGLDIFGLADWTNRGFNWKGSKTKGLSK